MTAILYYARPECGDCAERGVLDEGNFPPWPDYCAARDRLLIEVRKRKGTCKLYRPRD